MAQVAVMGSGSWGTTLAKVFADAGHRVRLWARRRSPADRINRRRENDIYLPGITLPLRVSATTDPAAALEEAAIVVLAVPSQTLRDNLASWGWGIPPESTVVSVAKGVEAETLMFMNEVIGEAAGIPADRIAVLSGPNLAREIAAEQPAATVVACVEGERARGVQKAIATRYLRPYTNSDVLGCEVGGACKNVIALACGMADGRGLGNNTTAMTITRGLAEITRLGVALGADPRTFSGLAGLGDLVATCASPLSRNRTFGYHLGRGVGIAEAKAATGGQVAEGVVSSKSIVALARRERVVMPIAEAVYRVCHEGVGVDHMTHLLMSRSHKPE